MELMELAMDQTSAPGRTEAWGEGPSLGGRLERARTLDLLGLLILWS